LLSFDSFKRVAWLPAAMASSYFFSAFYISITFAKMILSSIVTLTLAITCLGSFGNLYRTSIGFPSVLGLWYS